MVRTRPLPSPGLGLDTMLGGYHLVIDGSEVDKTRQLKAGHFPNSGNGQLRFTPTNQMSCLCHLVFATQRRGRRGHFEYLACCMMFDSVSCIACTCSIERSYNQSPITSTPLSSLATQIPPHTLITSNHQTTRRRNLATSRHRTSKQRSPSFRLDDMQCER